MNLFTVSSNSRDASEANQSRDGNFMTSEEQATLCELLRRILQLSPDATIEDINRALIEWDSLGSTKSLTALSVEKEVRQHLGISRDKWDRYSGDARASQFESASHR